MQMHKLHKLIVELGQRQYPIIIQPGLLQNSEWIDWSVYLSSKQVLIVTNRSIAPLYLELLKASLSGYQISELILADGESYKNLESFNQIIDVLIQNKHRRQTTLIALGGGVIGDLTGFAAACYQRGVGFMQIPTTLLAQVDSSVGGKTGVNHPQAKNMIGAFHQPNAVLIDVDCLKTLPLREFRAGMAEVIKYALIHDAKFFSWLEENLYKVFAKNPNLLSQMIYKSCKIKAQIVAADEYEMNLRAILNFGHTLGHALEAVLGYANILHGEAVAQGMIWALELSSQYTQLAGGQRDRAIDLIAACGFSPIKLKKNQIELIIRALNSDKKKSEDASIRFVLLEEIGKTIFKEFSENQMSDFLFSRVQ